MFSAGSTASGEANREVGDAMAVGMGRGLVQASAVGGQPGTGAGDG
jgi:hypothetical protein